MKLHEVQEEIDKAKTRGHQLLAFHEWATLHLLPIAAQCSETVSWDLSLAIAWIHVYNRDDLQRLLSLAPKWSKDKGVKTIEYYAECGGFSFRIYAHDNALPPTCKVVRTERVIPAQEAQTVIEESIVCEIPVEGGGFILPR